MIWRSLVFGIYEVAKRMSASDADAVTGRTSGFGMNFD